MDKKWYMVTTISGKEEKVIESLKNRIVAEDLKEFVIDDFKIMLVPHLSPKEFDKKNHGEEFKVREKNLFPGYIFLKMDMTNEAWFIVRNTQYVTGLVGSSGHRAKPTPVSNLEIRRMEKAVEKARNDFDEGKIKSPFLVGTIVEVVDGPTKGQSGPVIETNDDRGVSVVELILFERKTATEIEHKYLKVK
ncbi:transcription termination/antitermination protein NusG [Candidatus Mycoplasma mahonii]|uniref:transcription termination/antitermination protein NusG n=1 Tax=Candidatus Mycoplasma mahonii TaxID=3004105 RepID=UPI0026F3680C|nr:transcription termination/antitermination protein NusG [Candidatus Mycoplasma mahonii]WKX02653.1 transcription termination/antitermination protein NusG [Candidatus Mycoplasma mahonii]